MAKRERGHYQASRYPMGFRAFILFRTFRPSGSGNHTSLIIRMPAEWNARSDGIPIHILQSPTPVSDSLVMGILTEMLLMEDRSLEKKGNRNSRFPVPCSWLCQPASPLSAFAFVCGSRSWRTSGIGVVVGGDFYHPFKR